MEGVLGVSYDGTVIENGIGRLTTIRETIHKENISDRSMRKRHKGVPTGFR